jgi:SAM-dependent methyltransferase
MAHGDDCDASSPRDRTIATILILSCPICGAASAPDTVFSPSPLLRCRVCDFAFLPWAPDDRLYGDEYFANYDGEDYQSAERARRFESRRRLDLLARYMPPPARLLEIGGAAGFFLDEARQRGYEGAGVELNEEMATHAREALGLDVMAGRLEDVELGEQGFDGACAFHVLEHLPAPAEAVSALRAALRADGILLIEVPNAGSEVARRQGSNWPALKLPYHVGQYGPRSMTVLLERAGLEVLALDSVPFAHYAAPVSLGLPVRGAVALREVARTRAAVPPWRHASGHQLLRAVARRPASWDRAAYPSTA